MAKSPEEQAIDDLITPVSGQIDQTIKVFPDQNALDPNKTKGREHRTLLRTVITSLMAWVRSLLNYSTLTAYEATIPDTAVTAWQEEDGTKRKLTWQGLVNAVKAIFGTGIQPFNPALAYKKGDTFRDGDIVYQVVTAWNAGAYLTVSSVPSEATKLIANLGSFNIRTSTFTNPIGSSSITANVQNQAYILHPSANPGQVVSFVLSGRIPLGRKFAIYVKYNGLSTVQANDSSILQGDLSWPSGIVSGDWVCFEFLAKEEGKLSLTQKYIEGKAGSGTSQSASTGLPASSTLVFGNQAGESHLPLTSDTAVTFTLGAGPHVPMTTKRQPVILTQAAAINFDGPFTFQYHNIGATLAAGTYEFWFTYNEDNTISVSVPGSPTAPGSNITVDSALSATSENPVQNKVVKAALDLYKWSMAFTTTAKSRKLILDEAITFTGVVTHNVATVKYQLIVGSTLYTQRTSLGNADTPEAGTLNHDILNLSASDKLNYSVDVVITLTAGAGTGEVLLKGKKR